MKYGASCVVAAARRAGRGAYGFVAEALEPRRLMAGIGINFVGGGQPIAPGNPAGVVPQANWNNLGGFAGSQAGLLNDAGAATGVSAIWSAPSSASMAAQADGNRQLYAGLIQGSTANGVSQAATVTVRNVPYSLYDVYVYADGLGHAADPTAGSYTIHDDFASVTQGPYVDNASFSGSFTLADAPGEAGNYAVFTGLTGSGFTLTAAAESLRAPVNGIQIVGRQPALVVNSTADTNDGNLSNGTTTLREAVVAANSAALPGANVITFNLPGAGLQKITLGSPLIVSRSLTIRGPGANRLKVSGNNASRVFQLGDLTGPARYVLQGMTIADGLADYGGGVALNDGTDSLELRGVVVRDNRATIGGGGLLGIAVPSLAVYDSAFVNNRAEFQGGGIFLQNVRASITNSTISNNTGVVNAGGILHSSAFAGNTSRLDVEHTTLAGNNAPEGAGVFNTTTQGSSTSTLTLRNSALADNTGGTNFLNANGGGTGATFTSLGSNVSDDASPGFTAAGDRPSTNPLLDPVGDNGGGTLTNYPRAGSPAVDNADPSTFRLSFASARQSSEYDVANYGAERAIDSNLGNLTHTASLDVNPWWEGDLGGDRNITGVIVRNRANFQSRLRDLTVEVFDAAGARVFVSPLLNPENQGFTYPDGPDFLIAAPDNVRGRWVRVTRTSDPNLSGTGGQSANATDEANVLTLAEVEVYSQVLADQRGVARTVGFGIDIGATERTATNAPSVSSITVNDGSAQRSRVTGVTVTFDRAVTLDPGAITFTGRDGAGAGVAFAIDNPTLDNRTYLLTFGGTPVVAGSLADGVYDVVVNGQGVRARAAPLVTMTGTSPLAFHRLFGDADGDGDSDNADLFPFRGTYGKNSTNAGFLGYFDYDGDNDVDNADLLQVRSRRSTQFKDPPYSGTIFLDPDIITPSDPTAFVGLVYTGQGMRLMFDRRANAFVTLNAYLFAATYSDTPTVEIQVNPEFGSVAAAQAEASRFAPPIGRIPVALRRDLQTIWIHKGFEGFGGGNNNLLIHTAQADDYIANGILEETFVHEAVHTSLDAAHAASPGWLAAQNADGKFISTYARDNPTREDLAESFLPWLAVRFRRDRISQSHFDTINATIRNRLAYFDAQAFNLKPFVP